MGIKALQHLWRQLSERADAAFLAIDTEGARLEEFDREISLVPRRVNGRTVNLGAHGAQLHDIVRSVLRERGQDGRSGRVRQNWWFSPDGVPLLEVSSRLDLMFGAGVFGAVAARLSAWCQFGRIERAIDELWNEHLMRSEGSLPGAVDIYLVAGLSGGTGRGVWALVAFAVRQFFRKRGIAATIHGAFADVTCVPEVLCSPDCGRFCRLNALTGFSELSLWMSMRTGQLDCRYSLPSLTDTGHEESDVIPMPIDGTFPGGNAPLDAAAIYFGGMQSKGAPSSWECSRMIADALAMTSGVSAVEQVNNPDAVGAPVCTTCEVGIEEIRDSLRWLACDLFVRRLTDATGAKEEALRILDPYVESFRSGCFDERDVLPGDRPGDARPLQTAVSAYATEIDRKVAAFAGKLSQDRRRTDVEACIRDPDFFALPDEVAEKAFRLALETAWGVRAEELADRLVDETLLSESARPIGLAVAVLSHFRALVVEATETSRSRICLPGDREMTEGRDAYRFYCEFFHAETRPAFFDLLGRHFISARVVGSLTNEYRRMLWYVALFKVIRARAGVLRDIPAEIAGRLAGLEQISDVFQKVLAENRAPVRRIASPFIEPTLQAVSAALGHGGGENGPWRIVMRPILSEPEVSAIVETVLEVSGQDVRDALSKMILTLREPGKDREETGFKLRDAVRRLWTCVGLRDDVIDANFSFEAVLKRNVLAINELLAKDPAEELTAAIVRFAGDADCLSGDWMDEKAFRFALLSRVVHAGVAQVMSCAQGGRLGVWLDLPWNQDEVMLRTVRNAVRRCTSESPDIHCLGDLPGAESSKVWGKYGMRSLVSLSFRSPDEFFRNVTVLDGWKEPALSKELLRAEDSAGGAYFDRRGDLGWLERRSAVGFLSPRFVADPVFAAARWRPWTDEADFGGRKLQNRRLP